MTQIRPTPKDAILEAAFQVLSRRPDATLADVAARAGVGRATLHRHFASREALMTALAHAALEDLRAAVDAATAAAETHADGLRRAMRAMVPLADRRSFLANETVDADPSVAAAHRRDRADLHAAIDGARAEGAFAADASTDWVAEAFEALLYAAWAMVRAGEATPAQAADLAWRTLTQGLAPNQSTPLKTPENEALQR